MKITSLSNERVKLVRSLGQRKVRRELGLFLAEGAAILETARAAGWPPRLLIHHCAASDGPVHRQLVDWTIITGGEVLEVSSAVLEKLAAKDNPQSMLGVFEQRWWNLPPSTQLPSNATIVVLEEVRDPGNLGTIIRTIDAVGAAGLVLVGTTTDPFSHESVRATMGSIFMVPIARMPREAFIEVAGTWPATGTIVGTHLAATQDFRSRTYDGPSLLVMGGEGPGLSEELARACRDLVKIPMAGRLDSLNLAVATALTLYQMRSPYLRL